MTPRGFRQIAAHGIRTIVDLRNLEQAEADPQLPPDSLLTVRVPIEQGLDTDPEFARFTRDGWLLTPLYYATFLRRWPDRCARAVAAVATAAPGGVVVHCGLGRDRTGLVVMLLLELAGVARAEIVADHGLTAGRLRAQAARDPQREDDNALVDRVLAQAKRSREGAILDTLRTADVAARLCDAGLAEAELEAVRARLVGP